MLFCPCMWSWVQQKAHMGQLISIATLCKRIHIDKCVCKMHKICLKMFGRDYFLKIPGRKRDMLISHENSWFCNKIRLSSVFFKFHLNTYIEFYYLIADKNVSWSIKFLHGPQQLKNIQYRWWLTFDAVYSLSVFLWNVTWLYVSNSDTV